MRKNEKVTPNRLNALTDGVVAIVLTIMVLDLKMPADASFRAVFAVFPSLAAYVLAFVNVAIYWNNHHHMMQSAVKVSGSVLWANCTLLFWLTLIPLVIRWVDEEGIAPWPVACSALVLTFCTVSYLWLERALIRAEGSASRVRHALGSRKKEWASLLGLLVAIPVSFVSAYLSVALLVIVSVGWLIPDRRFEKMV